MEDEYDGMQFFVRRTDPNVESLRTGHLGADRWHFESLPPAFPPWDFKLSLKVTSLRQTQYEVQLRGEVDRFYSSFLALVASSKSSLLLPLPLGHLQSTSTVAKQVANFN